MVTRVEKVAAVVVLVVALDAYEYEYSSSEVRDVSRPSHENAQEAWERVWSFLCPKACDLKGRNVSLRSGHTALLARQNSP